MTYINRRSPTHQPGSPLSEPVCLTGGCSCGKLRYTVKLTSIDDAKASICHCGRCKKAFGGVFGVMVKVPVQGFRYTGQSGKPTLHKSDPPAGSTWYREFCNECGGYMCGYGAQSIDHFRNVALGSLDTPSAVTPKAEFYCSSREEWMPQFEGMVQFNKQ